MTSDSFGRPSGTVNLAVAESRRRTTERAVSRAERELRPDPQPSASKNDVGGGRG